MRNTPLYLLACGFAGLCSVIACDNDDDTLVDTATAVEIPATYDFEDVSYAGQQERLAMLAEMKAYMAASVGVGDDDGGVSAARLPAMFANAEGAGFSRDYAKDLRSKTLPAVQGDFDRYIETFVELPRNLWTPPASAGVAGRITTADESKTYLVDANGVEWLQVIEKGLMGATFYYQATSVYMGADKMSADNTEVVPGEGTAMEHHWDEAFGYLGVPRDFPANVDGVVFWGDYCHDRDGSLGTDALLMDALLKGRAAISAGRLDVRDEAIAEARAAWELVAASTAIHYLNVAEASDDIAVDLHALSEAVAFAYALPFNEATRVDRAAYRSWLKDLAGGEDFETINLYTVSDADIAAARAELAGVYGLGDMASSL